MSNYSKFEKTCREAKKWGIYMSSPRDLAEGLVEFSPWFTSAQCEDLFMHSDHIVLFEDSDTAHAAFRQIGEEHDSGIYAMLCTPDGKIVSENT